MVRLWRLQEGDLDADVDAIPEARQQRLGEYLARTGDDGARLFDDLDPEVRDDPLVAVALTESNVHCETVDPDLAERAWQLATDRLLEYNVGPRNVDEALEIGNNSTP